MLLNIFNTLSIRMIGFSLYNISLYDYRIVDLEPAILPRQLNLAIFFYHRAAVFFGHFPLAS